MTNLPDAIFETKYFRGDAMLLLLRPSPSAGYYRLPFECEPMSLISVGETGGREGENRMGLTAGTFLDRFVGRDKHYLFTQ